jgi:hypothetical protein
MRRTARTLFLIIIGVIFPSFSLAQQPYDGNNNLPPFGSFSGSDFDIVSLQESRVRSETARVAAACLRESRI